MEVLFAENATAVAPGDLEDFRQFASQRLARQGAESLVDVPHEWEAAREHAEALDSIRRGLADAEAGRTRPAQDVLNELRARLTTGQLAGAR